MTGILLAAVGNSYGAKPLNTVAPAVTGTAQVRQTLSCSTGTWTAAPPDITYTYQWKANGSPISGATSSTYNIAVAYFGQSISCDVTATNIVGSTTASSNSTAAVAANVPAAPTIGTATATGSSTATVSYTAPADNGGATITSYTAVSNPGGLTGTLSTSGSGTITVSGLSPLTSYTFRVYATNSVGNSAQSNASNSITTSDAYFLVHSPNAVTAAGGANSTVSIDSSNNIYGTLTQAYVNRWFKFNNAGTNTVQKDISGVATASIADFYFNSSNAVTIYGGGVSPPVVARVDNGGNVAWQKGYTDGSLNFQISASRTRSDGQIWGTGIRSDDGLLPYAFQLTSDGTWISAAALRTMQSNLRYNALAFDGSNNFYIGGYWGNSDRNAPLFSYNSSGNPRYHYRLSCTSGTSANRYASIQSIEPCGSNMAVTGFIGSEVDGYRRDFIMSVTQGSPPTVNWIISANVLGDDSERRLAVDSSNNIYMVHYAASGQSLAIVKVNSSGSVQWQRVLTTQSSGQFINKPDIAVSPNGQFFTVSAKYVFGTEGGIWFKAPTDGSRTGNFSGPGGTWSYSASGYSWGSYSDYSWAVNVNPGSFVYTATTVTTTSFATSNSSYTFNTYAI